MNVHGVKYQDAEEVKNKLQLYSEERFRTPIDISKLSAEVINAIIKTDLAVCSVAKTALISYKDLTDLALSKSVEAGIGAMLGKIKGKTINLTAEFKKLAVLLRAKPAAAADKIKAAGNALLKVAQGIYTTKDKQLEPKFMGFDKTKYSDLVKPEINGLIGQLNAQLPAVKSSLE